MFGTPLENNLPRCTQMLGQHDIYLEFKYSQEYLTFIHIPLIYSFHHFIICYSTSFPNSHYHSLDTFYHTNI
jgi:hypothetical protein